ncbi:MAG: hypothetical protein CMN10_09805 [Roseobacter sp.]|nr:hypothetical protein [Roseobacter sp.]MBV48842.1 hypothetical protein [Roseobacter sp.]
MCDLRFLHSDTLHFAHRNKADFGRAETVVSTGPTVAFRLSARKSRPIVAISRRYAKRLVDVRVSC